MTPYDPKQIEPKWQKKWESSKLYQAKDKSTKPKFYGLIEFPYPSGAGLHVGHVRSNTAMDIITRKRRMQGYNVLYPIGWDAFGLPTENYAIKTGIHPMKITKENTDTFRRQLKALGFGFDWSREVDTTDPKYYKWTQWIFLQLLKRGLAYKKKMAINWCPKDKIGLANEEVVDGKCERCGTPVEQREKEQWMLAITKYADRLDKDLDEVDFLEKIKIQQRNWIGRSEGAELDFAIKGVTQKIKVFTTRADTLFGVTYLVISPEYNALKELGSLITNWSDVVQYCADASKKTETVRIAEGGEKTGVELKGIKAINPVNGSEIPIYVADYVLASYGTGAIMAVPAHDKRDFEFAKKFGLPIVCVIRPEKIEVSIIKPSEEGGFDVTSAIDNKLNRILNGEEVFEGSGILMRSGQFDGLGATEAKRKIIELTKGILITNYKLRDWVFSRQRYWGEPIPVVHCPSCGIVPVPEKDLPVKLPDVQNYQPTDTGESPLAAIEKWVNTKCPQCKGKAKRETDTMPNWAGSSWYFLRYVDPKNSKAFADRKKLDYMMPVDWYNGGMEHTTLHLLYSRFWHKFLFDLGLVATSEPYKKRTSHGLIMGEGGIKMSKSIGNVINPDEIVSLYGADTLRLYEMFIGPFDQAVAWSTESIIGSRRFLDRVWRLQEKLGLKAKATPEIEASLHRTIKKVSEDIEAMRFNTAVSSLMMLLNDLEKEIAVAPATFAVFLQLLAPFAPHITEELWALAKKKGSVHTSAWPEFDVAKMAQNKATIAVQVNGKFRAELEIVGEISDDELQQRATHLPDVQKWVEGKKILKVIVVKGRLINIVVG